jgi:hypothetical protein
MTDASAEIDVSGCHEYQINVPLRADEAAGEHPSTWPAEVQDLIAREYRELRMRYPDNQIVARYAEVVSPQRVCVMTYFHRAPQQVAA